MIDTKAGRIMKEEGLELDKLSVAGMQFFGYHGVFPEENRLGQKYEVSLDLYLDLRAAGRTDALNETVNYALVYETVKQIVEGPPFKLIEALAENIASRVIENYTKVDECTVRVKKPNPPFDIHFDGVTVEIHRKRG